jgi:hypothetical protein
MVQSRGYLVDLWFVFSCLVEGLRVIFLGLLVLLLSERSTDLRVLLLTFMLYTYSSSIFKILTSDSTAPSNWSSRLAMLNS